MEKGESLLQCYNQGCGQEFDPKDNKEDSCIHHPGPPFFHDAYKGWSCCNKKSVNFTEFLNTKGCKKSYHSNVKPVEPPKRKVEKSSSNEVITYNAPKPKVAPDRPSFDAPMIKLQPAIGASLKEALQKCSQNATGTSATDVPVVSVGTSCKNNACRVEYQGPSTPVDCRYHSGVPVFHEGLKFWSCCTRRTTDFDAFLQQQGCAIGQHVWIKPQSNENSESTSCRYDWHQTGSHVYVSIFAKTSDPASTTVELNPVHLVCRVTFSGNKVFNLDLELHGVVDPTQSSVNMLATKVEVKLRKAEPCTWTRLEVPAERLKVTPDAAKSQTDANQATITDRVDAVDLSDL